MSVAGAPALVFVEGLPGTGKSTTAQWIAHELEARGRPAQWIYEEETPHAVLGPGRGPYVSWKDLLAHRLASWATFAATVGKSDTMVVVDSTFLQSSVMGTLRHGLEPDTVLAYLDRVADVVRPLAPALVYLRADDSDTALRTICERRGMAWTLHHITAGEGMAWTRARALRGFDGLLAYWREHARVCDAAVPRSRLRTLTVESSVEPWSIRRRRVADFLGLPWPPSRAPSGVDLTWFVGSYRGPTRREVRLSVIAGALVVDGLLWRGNRLLPRSPEVFNAESWPLRVTFEVAESGPADHFRVDAPTLWAGRLSGVYERVAA